MNTREVHVCERLKRLGFARSNRIKLYGLQFELVSDPLIAADNVIFVDGVENKSGKLTRVPIPLTVVRMAMDQVRDAVAAA
jgi:hypothetical protein